MPSREKYAPRHRNAPAEPVLKKKLRKSVLHSGFAVVATGLAVTGGVVVKDEAPAETASSAISGVQSDRAPSSVSAALAGDRARVASRSERRISLEKEAQLDQESGGQATRTEDLADEDPRDIARRLLPEFGFSASEFSCLDALWVSESDWDPHADNPTSSAYGIPQALTGGTHDNLPADYMTNPASQIRWGLEYIRDSYGSPCAAWEFKQGNNWY